MFRRLLLLFLVLLAVTGSCGCFSWEYVAEDMDFYPALDNCTVIVDAEPTVPAYNNGGHYYV
jgi:hypothetical protein